MDDSNFDGGFRKRPGDSSDFNAKRQKLIDESIEVAQHYNSREEVGLSARKESAIFQLKSLNNWIKSTLIGTYMSLAEEDNRKAHMNVANHYTTHSNESDEVPSITIDASCDDNGVWHTLPKPCVPTPNTRIAAGVSVLDLCGGKGGDLRKFTPHPVRYYVLADIASQSVDAARRRYNDLISKMREEMESNHGRSQQKQLFPAQFFAGNLCELRLHHYLHPKLSFDVVSCQFAFHYCFQSEEKARRMLENVTDRLRPGGYFVGTLPDARVIVNKLRQARAPHFGNSCYAIQFDDPLGAAGETSAAAEYWANVDFSTVDPFGVRYVFTLEDAVEEVPEYLVHFPTLCALAAEYGLRPVLYENFHTYFANHASDIDSSALRQFKMLDDNGAIPADQWEASNVYCVFAFQRVGQQWVGTQGSQTCLRDLRQDCCEGITTPGADPKEACCAAHPRLVDRVAVVEAKDIINPDGI